MEVIIFLILVWLAFVAVGIAIAAALEAIKYVIDTPRRWRLQTQELRFIRADGQTDPYISRRM